MRAGFSLQLGLLGLIAERGGFDGIAGEASASNIGRWRKNRRQLRLCRRRRSIPRASATASAPDEFVAIAGGNFHEAAADWLTGDAPFTAKLHPEYAPYADYDQLMRRDEWYGRE